MTVVISRYLLKGRAAVLVAQDADLYDLREGDDDEGDLLVDAARPGYRQVAAQLRDRILAGRYPAGTPIPGQAVLAAEFRADVAVVNRAVGQLERERLVRVGHGRPTVVRGRRAYRAEVAVGWARGETVPRAALDGAAQVLAAAEAADESLAAAVLLLSGAVLTIAVTVTAADAGHAADRAVRLAERACTDGWDLDGASVEARPADSGG